MSKLHPISSSRKPAERKTPKGRRPVITPAEGKEILKLFSKGETVSFIAEHFKRQIRTIARFLEREGAGSKVGTPAQAEASRKAAADAAARKESIERQSLNLDRIRQVKDDHFRLSQLIPKVMGKLLASALNDKRPVGYLEKDMRTLKQMMETIKLAREECYVLLQVEKHELGEEQESLPLLEIRELTIEDIQQMVSQSRVTDGTSVDVLSAQALKALDSTRNNADAPTEELDDLEIVDEGDESAPV